MSLTVRKICVVVIREAEEHTCRCPQKQQKLLKQLHLELKKERANNLVMEAQIREEISKEFSELFSDMQNDYK